MSIWGSLFVWSHITWFFSFCVFSPFFPRVLCILIDRFSPVFSSDCLLLSARGWKYSSRLRSLVGERSFTFYFSNVLGLSHEFLLKKHLVLSTKHQRQQTLSNKKKKCSINSQNMNQSCSLGENERTLNRNCNKKKWLEFLIEDSGVSLTSRPGSGASKELQQRRIFIPLRSENPQWSGARV